MKLKRYVVREYDPHIDCYSWLSTTSPVYCSLYQHMMKFFVTRAQANIYKKRLEKILPDFKYDVLVANIELEI